MDIFVCYHVILVSCRDVYIQITRRGFFDVHAIQLIGYDPWGLMEKLPEVVALD
jgi:hypothetical protein